jgi:two-component system sensor histidine kinase AlgZ
MSPLGATEPERQVTQQGAEETFLPDFCEPRMVLGVVLVAELLAFMLTLARYDGAAFLNDLARVSFLVQWLALTSAGLLCFVRPWLAGRDVAFVSGGVFLLLLANTALLSVAAVLIGRWLLDRGLGAGLFPLDYGFVLPNLLIALIVGALLLRYFYVSHQWRRHVRAEARSRIDALQARIRPHFLFNSMNTIASLTRTDPARAEEAVEDLADLFRATLSDAQTMLTLKEELELSRIYQRIESLRLGERLRVQWDVGSLPMRARVPGLTLQPLLENAIYHGIEPLTEGGLVRISGRVEDGRIELEISNPVRNGASPHSGNRVALNNIRERLELAFPDRASLDVAAAAASYSVTLRFPATE